MITPDEMKQLSVIGRTFPQQFQGLTDNMAAIRQSMANVERYLEVAQQTPKPLPFFFDLKTGQADQSLPANRGSQSSFIPANTIEIVSAFMSASIVNTFLFHEGESSVFFTHWYRGGLDHVFPFSPDYPWIVARGTRIWVEQLVSPYAVFHIKLIAYLSSRNNQTPLLR